MARGLSFPLSGYGSVAASVRVAKVANQRRGVCLDCLSYSLSPTRPRPPGPQRGPLTAIFGKTPAKVKCTVQLERGAALLTSPLVASRLDIAEGQDQERRREGGRTASTVAPQPPKTNCGGRARGRWGGAAGGGAEGHGAPRGT